MPGPSAPRIAIDSPLQAPHSIQSSVGIAHSKRACSTRSLTAEPFDLRAPIVPFAESETAADGAPEGGAILAAHLQRVADEGFAAFTKVSRLGRLRQSAVDP